MVLPWFCGAAQAKSASQQSDPFDFFGDAAPTSEFKPVRHPAQHIPNMYQDECKTESSSVSSGKQSPPAVDHEQVNLENARKNMLDKVSMSAGYVPSTPKFFGFQKDEEFLRLQDEATIEIYKYFTEYLFKISNQWTYQTEVEILNSTFSKFSQTLRIDEKAAAKYAQEFQQKHLKHIIDNNNMIVLLSLMQTHRTYEEALEKQKNDYIAAHSSHHREAQRQLKLAQFHNDFSNRKEKKSQKDRKSTLRMLDLFRGVANDKDDSKTKSLI